MILSLLTAARAWFTALPNGVRRLIYGAGLAVMAALLVWWWLRVHDQNTIKKHEAQISAEVSTKSAAASESAQETVTDTKARIEKENDDARKAADAGDDPLADGLRSLRRKD